MSYTPLELAKAFMQTGELEDALDALNQHLDAHPQDEAVRLMRVETLMRMRDVPERLKLALDDLENVHPASDDQIFDVVMRKATLYERLNQPEKAQAAVRQGLEQIRAADTITSQLIERLTERLVLLLSTQQAYDEARQALEAMPRTWRWVQWSGDIAAQAGDFSQAVQDYSEALAHFANEEDAMHNQWKDGIKARLLLVRGSAYQQLGDLTRAAADYEAGFLLVPDDPVVKFKRGLIFVLDNESERGLADCIEAYRAAKPVLRDAMDDEIQNDPRFEVVRAALKNL